MTESVLIVRKRILPYSETFIAAQAKALPTFTPVFAGIKKEPSGIDLLQDYPVLLQDNFARLPSLSRGLLSGYRKPDKRWLDAIKEFNPAIVHAHFGPSGGLGLALANALNLPLVVTFHGYDITRQSVDKRYDKLRQELFNRANKIIAVSEFIREKLLMAGCPESIISRHYVGIETEETSVINPLDRLEKSSFPHVVFIGRLVKQKGCEHVISAMRKIRAVHASARLDVIGEGPEKDSLMTQANEVGGVRFLGRVSPDQVRQLLQQAWVLCNPSIVDSNGATEGLGMVFLEAQMSGTPAVSFDSGGVTEAIVDGETGYTVPLGNSAMLAARLLELLGNPMRRQAMGNAGQRHVQKNFNLKTQSRSLEAVYREVIAEFYASD